jgi:hypothetical protein
MRMALSCEQNEWWGASQPARKLLLQVMRVALSCEGRGRILGPDRYWRDLRTGRLRRDRAWCSRCYKRLLSRSEVVPVSHWCSREYDHEGGQY